LPYTIRTIAGEPCFDALEVLKLGCDLTVSINDRIFAQAQLGRNRDLFFARIWSFEVTISCDSVFCVALQSNENQIELSVKGLISSHFICNKNEIPDSITSYSFEGEDLQGIYHGVVMLTPIETVLSCLKLSADSLPAAISGNVYRENPSLSAAALNKESRIPFILT
jgi:hypothetical protein